MLLLFSKICLRHSRTLIIETKTLRGGRSKNCSKQKIFRMFVIMPFTHSFDLLALKNKNFWIFRSSLIFKLDNVKKVYHFNKSTFKTQRHMTSLKK